MVLRHFNYVLYASPLASIFPVQDSRWELAPALNGELGAVSVRTTFSDKFYYMSVGPSAFTAELIRRACSNFSDGLPLTSTMPGSLRKGRPQGGSGFW